MDPFITGLGLSGVALAGYGASASELLRKTPSPTSSGAAEGALLDALDARVKATTNNPIEDINRTMTDPEDITARKYFKDSDKFAHYTSRSEGKGGIPGYTINPNADRGLLAHELGHVAFGQTDFGNKLQSVRGNKRLGRALEAAAFLAPAAFAAGSEGDGELLGSAALATALAAPTLIDEFEGSRRGLALLSDAGMKATPGQRARMAGGLLSYAARPILLAAAGVTLGNTAANALQTDGTLMP